MSTSIKHFSHPDHELILKENDVIEENATCCVCNQSVIGFPTYTCNDGHDGDDIGCKMFYLHRNCAELPKYIDHDKHNRHNLTLQRRPNKCFCDVCEHEAKFTYACAACDFDVCVVCAFPCPDDDDQQRALRHEGHQEHILTLQRQALFKCDACWEEAKDFSYVCFTCDFWIHKRCAFQPQIIPEPTYHHHPLLLTYSIPEIHRIFFRLCGICDGLVHVHSWFYYCHKCTCCVHMKCATSTVSKLIENEAAGSNNDPNLIEFPLPSEESLIDLIATQFLKFKVDSEGVREDTITISAETNDPHIIEEHWSHPNHPLELQFIISKNDNDDNDDNTKVLLCDGCIRPITLTCPSYYGCIECGFYLHSVCATKLPHELPVGVFSFHPQHSLVLGKRDKFYEVVQCGVCDVYTNGFYYVCEACDIRIDIYCAFLPAKIIFKSHKHHPLVQRPSSGSSICSVSKFGIVGSMEYACEICSNFQIGMYCVTCPSTTRHKYDDHAITLRYPPFFYEGAFYCETCEEQLNNQVCLFNCGECDHSFHYGCIRGQTRMKLGGNIELDMDNQVHTCICLQTECKKQFSLLRLW